MALPALTTSAAYAVSELLRGRGRPGQLPASSRVFYATLAAATALGCILNLAGFNPIRALYWSAVLNGVVTVPLMIAMLHLSTREAVMGPLKLSLRLRLLGWLATAVMGISVLGMTVTWLT